MPLRAGHVDDRGLVDALAVPLVVDQVDRPLLDQVQVSPVPVGAEGMHTADAPRVEHTGRDGETAEESGQWVHAPC